MIVVCFSVKKKPKNTSIQGVISNYTFVLFAMNCGFLAFYIRSCTSHGIKSTPTSKPDDDFTARLPKHKRPLCSVPVETGVYRRGTRPTARD